MSAQGCDVGADVPVNVFLAGADCAEARPSPRVINASASFNLVSFEGLWPYLDCNVSGSTRYPFRGRGTIGKAPAESNSRGPVQDAPLEGAKMRYQISNFEHLKAMLATVADDDLSLPWDTYQCLEWDRYLRPRRIASIYIPERKKKCFVHRMSFEMTRGPLEDGKNACHHCDNPPCFRPVHLFAGTQKENMEDCVSKGRMPRGSKRPISILTEESVAKIRLLDYRGIMRKDLATMFGVSESTIWQIFSGRSWRHVPHHGNHTV